MRRQQLTEGARPQRGSPDPLCFERLDGITPSPCYQGGTDVQQLEIQVDENVEPNDLWVGKDCQDYPSIS